MFGPPFASPAQHFEGSQNYFFTQRAHAVPHTIGIHVTHRDFNPTYQFTAGIPAKPITLSVESVHLNFTQTLPLGADSFVVEVYATSPAPLPTPSCPATAAAARYALRQTPWSLPEPQKLPNYTYQQYYQTMHGRLCGPHSPMEYNQPRVVGPPAGTPVTPAEPPLRIVTISIPLNLPSLDALLAFLNTQLQTNHIDMQFTLAHPNLLHLRRNSPSSDHYRFRWWNSPQDVSFGRDCLGLTSPVLDFLASEPTASADLPVEFPVLRDLFLTLDDHGQSRAAEMTSVAPSVNLHRDVIARISLQPDAKHDQVATLTNGYLHSDPRTFASGDQNRPLAELSCRFFDAFGNQVSPRSFTLSIRCATL